MSRPWRNQLFYGDNLDVLRRNVADESVDLIYLDPPFNSNRSYNVLFKHQSGEDSQAQIEAFDDTWSWSLEAEEQYDELINGGAPVKVADAMEAMRKLLGENEVLAYLVMMTARLIELHRVLKSTGSMYLHCDPTASHYLKVVLDAIFGPTCFRNEIIWRRTGAHSPRRSFGPIHDTLLFYTKSPSDYYFRVVRRPYTLEHVKSRYRLMSDGRWKFTSGGNVLTGPGSGGGESSAPWRGFDPTLRSRHWAIPGFVADQMPAGFKDLSILDQLEAAYNAGLIEITPGNVWPTPVRYLRPGDGLPIGDIWAYQPGTKGCLADTDEPIDWDVAYLGPTDPERLGFPTQKPLGLLERIIRSSCPDGGLILDPFCGCGTTIGAAQGLGRRWMGIDITYLAIDLIEKRMRHVYGDSITDTYTVVGIPRDVEAAAALFHRSPFEFERWAVSLVDGQPNEKQVADRGIDGIIRFLSERKNETGKIIVSVKGGKQLGPQMVRDLLGTVSANRAAGGVLVTLSDPTRGMVEASRRSGFFRHNGQGLNYPKVQLISVKDLLAGKRVRLPPVILPYIQARRRPSEDVQEAMF